MVSAGPDATYNTSPPNLANTSSQISVYVFSLIKLVIHYLLLSSPLLWQKNNPNRESLAPVGSEA